LLRIVQVPGAEVARAIQTRSINQGGSASRSTFRFVCLSMKYFADFNEASTLMAGLVACASPPH
jgi:hypothetical protein